MTRAAERARTGEARLPRLLAGVHAERGAATLRAHLDRHGPPPSYGGRGAARALIELVADAGLQGRGGSAFPTAAKLHAVAGAGRRTAVVANGVEGEPASGKDKVLLRHVPQLVLDGVALAAGALGADRAIVALAAGDALGRRAVLDAIAERERHRLDRVALVLETVPDRFVAGEETALLNSLGGGPAKPTFTPPRPFERGLRGFPTLVLNVETFANLALLARHGAAWFREVGTDDEPGSVLVTLTGAVRAAGVHEVPLGLPLAELLAAAGGPTGEVSAYLVGGYFGTWLPADVALGRRLLDGDLATAGARLGARAIHALSARACGVVETARLLRYLAEESAGQCGPCVHGLAALAETFGRLADPHTARRALDDRFERRLAQIHGRGACRHPDGAVALAASAARAFADEIALHVAGRCSGDGRLRLPLPSRRARAA